MFFKFLNCEIIKALVLKFSFHDDLSYRFVCQVAFKKLQEIFHEFQLLFFKLFVYPESAFAFISAFYLCAMFDDRFQPFSFNLYWLNQRIDDVINLWLIVYIQKTFFFENTSNKALEVNFSMSNLGIWKFFYLCFVSSNTQITQQEIVSSFLINSIFFTAFKCNFCQKIVSLFSFFEVFFSLKKA